MCSIKSIGVLTSGGDAPGMNACIRAVIRTALYHGIETFGIYDGYKGLVRDNMEKLDRFSDTINRGGTMLGTARLPEFKDESVRQTAIDNLRKRGIDALVVIGGDGSYRGARDLFNMGFNVVCLPGTIDNDIASTEYTIGFDTALNTINDAVDKLRDTAGSHRRCSVLEVMGRHCGDLAIFAGICGGAEIVITDKKSFDEEKIIDELRDCYNRGKRHAIVLVTEMVTDVHEFARKIEANTGYNSRATILGHVQRGGSPSAKDRVLASQLGCYAVDVLQQGYKGQVVGLINNKAGHMDINEALEMKRPESQLYDVFNKISK